MEKAPNAPRQVVSKANALKQRRTLAHHNAEPLTDGTTLML